MQITVQWTLAIWRSSNCNNIGTFENFADGLISKDEYIELKEKYDRKESQIKKKIQSHAHKYEAAFWETEFEDWLEKLMDGFNVEEMTQEMVLCLIDRIYIYKDNVIEVNYKFRLHENGEQHQVG